MLSVSGDLDKEAIEILRKKFKNNTVICYPNRAFRLVLYISTQRQTIFPIN